LLGTGNTQCTTTRPDTRHEAGAPPSAAKVPAPLRGNMRAYYIALGDRFDDDRRRVTIEHPASAARQTRMSKVPVALRAPSSPSSGANACYNIIRRIQFMHSTNQYLQTHNTPCPMQKAQLKQRNDL
jgi:hypothetical protein